MKTTAAALMTVLIAGSALAGCGGHDVAARQPRVPPTTLNAYEQRVKEKNEADAKQEAREADQATSRVGYLAFLRGTIGPRQLKQMGTLDDHVDLGNNSCKSLDRGAAVNELRDAVSIQDFAPEVITLYLAGATRYLCPEYDDAVPAVVIKKALVAQQRTRAAQEAREARRARIKAAAKRERIAKAQAAKRKKRKAPTSAQGSGSGCAAGYSPCVPPFPPDQNCDDVDGPITVTGSDPHELDSDGDGLACET